MDLFITNFILKKPQDRQEKFTEQSQDDKRSYGWFFWFQITMFIIFFIVAACLSWWINGLFEYGTGEKVLYAFLSGFMSYWYLFYLVLFRRDLLQIYQSGSSLIMNQPNNNALPNRRQNSFRSNNQLQQSTKAV